VISVKLVMLQQKVPARSHIAKESEKQEPVRKVPIRVKVMTMFSTTEKVKSKVRKLYIQGSPTAKQGNRVTSMIRIQIEEIKRKVKVNSPSALQFIGPGDY
jgi:hypothetical protein